jgi:GTPase involved in cell partitioning and DNA repair
LVVTVTWLLLLQVVDASAADPGTDYLAVREELRMYNPEYVTRPHVVALNKVDLEDAGALAFQGDGFTFIGT